MEKKKVEGSSFIGKASANNAEISESSGRR